ncbi:UNVERIFIED_CONTAM: hypothetical protein Sindi_2136400 [Sesamum indicum]
MVEVSATAEMRGNPLPKKLQLHGSDHPEMVLVSVPLTDNNYLNWSFGIKRALHAKMKLGFMDGTSDKPNTDDPFFEKWIRVDSMVINVRAICKEALLSNDPSEATSKRADPTLPHFRRGLRRSLRQAIVTVCRWIDEATNEDKEGENEGEGSYPEEERVRSPVEEAETPESSAVGEPSGSIPGEVPSLEEGEEEKLSQSP